MKIHTTHLAGETKIKISITNKDIVELAMAEDLPIRWEEIRDVLAAISGTSLKNEIINVMRRHLFRGGA